MAITEITRKHLFADIRASNHLLWGDLHPAEFLSRLYDLKSIPSVLSDNAYDEISQLNLDLAIREEVPLMESQEEINEFLDNLHYWILDDSRFELQNGDDSILLRFLCATIHPIVRSNAEEIEEMLQLYNGHLRHDGFQIFEESRVSGKPVFAARYVGVLGIPNLSAAKELLGNDAYIAGQIARMEDAINKGDTYSAIGTAKEFIETCCKTILEECNVGEPNNANLPKLIKSTYKALSLTPDDISDASKAEDAIKLLSNGLATAAQGIAELRNLHGSGHGKAAGTKGLQSRHAKLAVRAATALVIFLFETHKAHPAPTQESQED